MHVSLQPRFASESNLRVMPRRRLAEDNTGGDINRIFENAGENRRQNQFARRRPQNNRLPAGEELVADPRPSLMRPALPAFHPLAKTAEFWALLGAVAPETGIPDSPVVPKPGHVPTIQELLDQVIATH